MNNKQQKQSPPVPPQTNFVKILHGLIIVSLFIMIGSGLQIYNATPVFGGKSGWPFPKWMTLGGWLAGGEKLALCNYVGICFYFTNLWHLYFYHPAMEKKVCFWARS